MAADARKKVLDNFDIRVIFSGLGPLVTVDDLIRARGQLGESLIAVKSEIDSLRVRRAQALERLDGARVGQIDERRKQLEQTAVDVEAGRVVLARREERVRVEEATAAAPDALVALAPLAAALDAARAAEDEARAALQAAATECSTTWSIIPASALPVLDEDDVALVDRIDALLGGGGFEVGEAPGIGPRGRRRKFSLPHRPLAQEPPDSNRPRRDGEPGERFVEGALGRSSAPATDAGPSTVAPAGGSSAQPDALAAEGATFHPEA